MENAIDRHEPETTLDAPGRTLGYARVSTDLQELNLQIDALLRHGVDKQLIFTDKLAGAKADRPGLRKCLESL